MTGGAPLVRRLIEVVDAMAADLDTGSLLHQLSHSAMELFGSAGASWCELDGDVLTIRTAAGLSTDLLGLTFPLEGSAVGALLATGERSLVAPAARFPHLNDRIYTGPRDRMATALATVGGRTTGALYVTLTPEHPFGADELEVLELLASHAGMALHHLALYDQAEQACRESAAVLAAMADGVAVVDAAGVVRSWSDAMSRLTGQPADRVVGRPVPFPLPEPGAVLAASPLPGRWVDLVVSPLGERGEQVVSARDVTAAKELEAAQEVFLATASHELRTPLTVLRGYGETLLRHWDALPDERRRELVERMLDRTAGMTSLVEQLLQASAAGVSADTRPAAAFDLTEAVRAAVAVVAGSDEAHPVVLDAPAPVPAVGRRDTVAGVLDQLVENAVKYSPGGSCIEVAVRAEGDRAVLTVADRGRGVTDEERERVFERFYRGSGADGGAPGAGLGLWIVRTAVESQAGTVTAAARPGGGTVVRVELPSPGRA